MKEFWMWIGLLAMCLVPGLSIGLGIALSSANACQSELQFQLAKPGKEVAARVVAPRFIVGVKQDEVSSVLHVVDAKTGETILIGVSEKNGTSLACWEAEPTSLYPKLAISPSGIQLRTKTGTVRRIDIEELAKLDTQKSDDDAAVIIKARAIGQIELHE